MDIEGAFFDTSEYEIIKKKIGEGTFGKIYIAKNIKENKLYALKIIKTHSNFSGRDQMLLMRESIILNKLKHPGIVSFKGVNFQSFKDPNILQPSIITEYIEHGSLKLLLDKEKTSNSDPNWSPTKKYITLLGISNAMKYLHKQGIIHRDLKPENILIDENYYPKICDFGLSRCFEKELTKSIELTISGQFGTPLYMAPETILCEDHCTSGVDIYAFSMLAYEIVSKKVPFFELKKKMNVVYLGTKVTSGYRPIFPEYVPQKMQNLISRCWNEKPNERPSFEEIFNELASDFNCLGEKVDEEEVQKYISMLEKNQSPNNNSDLLKKKNTNCNISNELFIKSLHDFHGSKNEINSIEALNLLKLSSDKGNSYASYTLGLMYVNGNGVEKDFEKGKHYFELSSEQGNSAGLFGIAYSYHFGNGVEKDYSKAVEYYQRASELGNSDAFVRLGDLYYNGEGFEKDYSKAVEYYQRASELGNSDAFVRLGSLYYSGKGFEEDYSKASEYYQKASELGNSYAYVKLGDLYYNGEGFEEDYSKAAEYYQKASELGNSYAFIKLGDLYYNGEGFDEDYLKAAEYYQRASELGNSDAFIKLGDLYYNGEGFEEDYLKAVEYYQKASELGNSYAFIKLGDLYYNGEGFEEDYLKAAEYYQRASELGNSDAFVKLGDLYYNGEGFEEDYSKAAEYYQKASELGNSDAFVKLGDLYYNGEGFEEDYSKASEYYQKASELGNSDAFVKLSNLNYNEENVLKSFQGDNILYVGNLSYNTTDDEIKEFFSKFGPVTNAKILTTLFRGERVSRGYGFVQMGDHESFEKVLSDKEPLVLGNRTLRINPYRLIPKIFAVFLDKLPEGTTSDDIKNALKDFEIVNIRIHESQKKRFAFVTFETEEIMKACCEKKSVNIKGSNIIIFMVRRNRRRTRRFNRRRFNRRRLPKIPK